ncbi:hypothetical protein [Microvirga splendida]|uniref:Tc toxin complex TcA C-terminal TcB-binding domain-containing protein n=1 Tax=Microvirga splendida TaxID=2795727 RepID=A0ABS0Y8S3_9HYPH|nr:hypothetical protein [Microvirga splendida]MBJ6128505.1 hypothetical protein [Microvirga splendida]
MADRLGSPLLAINTLRAPDRSRSDGIQHLALTMPPSISTQVAQWEARQRNELSPQEAAAMLWSVPAAAYLTGAVEAWRNIPGVSELRAAWERLANEDPANWPANQAALRTYVADATPDGRNWSALSRAMASVDTLALLNDVVLIFKYAALHMRRPLRLAVEVYRLARAILDAKGPATRDEVEAWLRAPIMVPQPLSGPLRRRGAHPPPAPKPPQPPTDFPIFDISSPDAVRALKLLRTHLDDIENVQLSGRIGNVLREAGVTDRKSIERIITDVTGRPDIVPTDRAPDDRREWLPPLRATPAVVRMQLFGATLTFDTAEASARMAKQRQTLARRLFEALPDDIRRRLGQSGVALEDLPVWHELLHGVTNAPSYLEPVGRNDLLLVRQVTTGYRRAEVAYIENVMIGETRTRHHTQRVLSRQEFSESIEREVEETRDLQVSDKASLSREVSKVVEEDLRTEGSVQVTSRGPTKVVASASVSYERSTEEAAKSAEEYARETIERAVKRTLDRLKRESKSLFEQETIEENHHGFERDGNAADHVSGVYQYLERISRAKMFWYGERELYDLLIPEPAALIWQLATTHKTLQLPIEAPDADLFASLTVDNIADKREAVIRAYRVTDIPPLPAATKEIPVSFSATGGGDSAKHASDKELQVPDGYEVIDADFAISAEVEDDEYPPNGGISVAGQVQLWEITLSGNKGQTQKSFTFATPLPGPAVPVAMNADNFTSIAVTGTFRLRLTAVAAKQWAISAYGRVAERYEQLRREYAQAVIQATVSQGPDPVTLPMGTRQWLNQIVRAELQRSAIDLMRNAPVDYQLVQSHPYANADGTLSAHPVADPVALHEVEPEVRFLQQAFEWEHLTWILYPYFWGRRSEWNRTVVTNHPDPDFNVFLNAGAARLQIPVRPGFESMVKHFMETGEVYLGEGLPSMGDEGYLPFIGEQLTTLGPPGDEVPWPPDAPREWDVIAPTSLLLVRTLADSQLPAWDPSTGAEI